MTVEQALALIRNVCEQIQAPLATHQQIQTALATIEAALVGGITERL